jgi:hypothetical protein
MAMPDMGKMIGPLPLGAWLAVVAGGLGVAIYTKRQAASTTAVDPTRDTSNDPGVGLGGSEQYVDVTPPSNDGKGGVSTRPTTNDEWATQATNYLIGQGYPAAMADQAIRRYVATEGLSVSEVSMVEAALRYLGPTPTPLPPPIIGIPTTPIPPSPKPKPPPPKPAQKPYTYYTRMPGFTLQMLALIYHVPVDHIWEANKVGVTRLDGSKGILKSYNNPWHGRLIIPRTNVLHK